MSAEPEFFDTNILIAATVKEHVHHRASNSRLAKLASGRGACAAHTLAETYTGLTRLSGGYARAPLDALTVIQYAQETFTLITLTPREVLRTIEAAAHLDIRGPMLYDALLMGCARKVNAKWIYTFNIKHFRKVAPDLASRIVEP